MAKKYDFNTLLVIFLWENVVILYKFWFALKYLVKFSYSNILETDLLLQLVC